MRTLGRTTRNGKKAAARRVTPGERPHPAIAKLAVALKEYKEAVEQQAATAQILRAISRSSSDPQPVFEAIVENAHRLCGAVYSILYRYDGEKMSPIASRDVSRAAIRAGRSLYPAAPRRDHIVGRAILEGGPIHTADLPHDPRFPGNRNVFSKMVRRRAVLAVPLLRDGVVIGVIATGRAEARPFTKKEISLLQTFADQAVIAMENVRLFNETKEALERQTGTSEILRVISNSPTEIQPVLDAVAATAARLCEATDAVIQLREGDVLRFAAHYGTIPQLPPGGTRAISRQLMTGRAVLEGRQIHVHDLQAEKKEFPQGSAVAKEFGYRTMLVTPLMREGKAIGTILIRRTEVRPFSDKHLALVRTFADQAVIAIENVRLFNETKEALEHQKASADILRVVAGSIENTDPVFEAITRAGMRLIPGSRVSLIVVREDQLHYVSHSGIADERRSEVAKLFPVPLDRQTVVGTAILDKRMIHVPDVVADCKDFPVTRKVFSKISGSRAILAVPLVRKRKVIGAINVSRETPGPFTDKQIALANTFADQAVIAIQNAKMFREIQDRNAELKQSLDFQGASGEILASISSSITDAKPVFDAIVQSVLKIFGGLGVSITLVQQDRIELVAVGGWRNFKAAKRDFPMPVNRESVNGIAILERRVVNLGDTLSPEAPPRVRANADRFRAIAAAPMLREGAAIGAISVTRKSPGAFTEKQVALLRTFADQAVIAIENVRLFNETKEALEQQTAISEVLRVISDSPTDVKPVLEAVAVRAAKICEASDARIWLVEGDGIRHAAGFGDVPMPVELGHSLPLERGVVPGRAILDRAPVHVEDMAKLSRDDYPISREMQERSGFRTILAVPLMREQRSLGAIMLRRMEVRSFTDKQIALLKTFADQAAIAIENVRLFNETKEALDQQTSTAEVLKTISRSTFDLDSVLQTLLDNATRLSGARQAVMLRPDAKGNYLPAVTFNYPADSPVIARLREHPIRPGPDSTSGRVLLERKPIHIADVLADPEYRRRDLVEVGGYRTVLSVPMLRDGEAIGLITLNKGEEVDPFTDKQMEIVTTFADQAVIAIENVRLFKEIEEKSAQLEVANKHKSDFLANMSHELRTPLNAIIGFSEALMEKMFGELNDKQADYLKDIHESGRHLLSLINDILDLSKIEAGRMELEVSSFHLPTALSNAMTLIRERAQRHAIELGLEVDERLGEFQADERKFKQIMLNLLSNAVKFTPDGGRVDVCAKTDTGKIEIAVKDTGIGIAPEDQAAVFEEFKQVGGDQMRKAEGTGLGLALTRRFVELHGGAIRLESTPGKGSTFTVSLPLRP